MVTVSFLFLRYFLGDSVLEEVTFGWPRQAGPLLREQLAFRLQTVFRSVSEDILTDILLT